MTTRDKLVSSVGYELMGLIFKFRDFFWPRLDLLNEAGVEIGHCILDYGCGPGSYIVPLAEIIGPSGKIYALDKHPLAIKKVRQIGERKGITVIETIQSDCNTGLSNNHVDIVLLYDTFHDLSKTDNVLQELHRVLKPEGILSFSDHHMREQDILTRVTSTGMFRLSKKGKKTYSFSKVF